MCASIGSVNSDKEASGTWTSEVFRVNSHNTSQPIPMIRVKDLLGEPVLGSLYAQEYQSIVFNSKRKVDRVLETRRLPDHTVQYLVSFVGFPEKYSEWIDSKP
jgi:hypothetical protein